MIIIFAGAPITRSRSRRWRSTPISSWCRSGPAFSSRAISGTDDRWRDWLVCGALFGVAFPASTSVIMIAALLVGAAREPYYRRIFRNPKFYLAVLVSVPVMAINIVPELMRGDAIRYGMRRFDVLAPTGDFWGTFVSNRAESIGHLLRSFVFYGAPALVGLGVPAWRGEGAAPQAARGEAMPISRSRSGSRSSPARSSTRNSSSIVHCARQRRRQPRLCALWDSQFNCGPGLFHRRLHKRARHRELRSSRSPGIGATSSIARAGSTPRR